MATNNEKASGAPRTYSTVVSTPPPKQSHVSQNKYEPNPKSFTAQTGIHLRHRDRPPDREKILITSSQPDAAEPIGRKPYPPKKFYCYNNEWEF